MDFIGWLSIVVLALLAAGASIWQSASDRRRARLFRTFASARGMSEIPAGARVAAMPPELRRSHRVPAFRADDGPAAIFIVPLSTRVRWGHAWALCTQSSTAAPVLVLNLTSSDLWRRFGRKPRSWVRANAPHAEFVKHFAVYVPSDATLERALPPDLVRALTEIHSSVVAWIVRHDGIVVLMLREPYGASPSAWLSPALDAFTACTRGSSR